MASSARSTLPPALQQGFRPFFFLGASWAAVALLLWLAALAGALRLPTAMDPASWHRHEMLFGYVAAIIAAFLLTAIPNWTGRLPLRGMPLAGLVLLWAAGRVAVLGGNGLGLWGPVLLDAAFPFTLAAVAAREVVAGRNLRNLPVVLLVTLFAAANLLSHLEAVSVIAADMLGDRLAIAVGAMLVALIGGRIIPSFTTNRLKARGDDRLPAPFGGFDKSILALTGLALLAWLILPEAAPAGLLLILAGIGAGLRLARWRGSATLGEPLLFVLHVGHAWLALALALMGLAALGLVPRSLALHAMTAGTFGTMTLAVMTRAALGHTGRPLVADGWTVAIYALVNLGALARLVAAAMPAGVGSLLHLAGLAWGGAFLLYAVRYAPVLLGPSRPARPAGNPALHRGA